MSTPTLDNDPWADDGGYYSAPPPPGYYTPPPLPVPEGPTAAKVDPNRPWWYKAAAFVLVAVLAEFFGGPGQDLYNELKDLRWQAPWESRPQLQPVAPGIPAALMVNTPGLIAIEVESKNDNGVSMLDLAAVGNAPLEVCDGCELGGVAGQQVQPGNEVVVCQDCDGQERRVLRTLESDTLVDVVLYDHNSDERFSATSDHALIEPVSDTRVKIRFDDGGGGGSYVPDGNFIDLVIYVTVLG